MLLKELKEQVLKLPKCDRFKAIEQMCGLLKTDQPAPTEEKAAVMLEERRVGTTTFDGAFLYDANALHQRKLL